MDESTRNMMLGIDSASEIFTLWYEVTYLRMIVSIFIHKNTEKHSLIPLTDEEFEYVRKEAQQLVQSRFPVCKLDFCLPTEEQLKQKRDHIENLRMLNAKLGGIFGTPNITPEAPNNSEGSPNISEEQQEST